MKYEYFLLPVRYVPVGMRPPQMWWAHPQKGHPECPKQLPKEWEVAAFKTSSAPPILEGLVNQSLLARVPAEKVIEKTPEFFGCFRNNNEKASFMDALMESVSWDLPQGADVPWGNPKFDWGGSRLLPVRVRTDPDPWKYIVATWLYDL